MWDVALKRWRLSLRNGWFLAAWAVGGVMAAAAVWVSWIDYQDRVRLFEASRLGQRMAVENAGSYAQLELVLERRPEPLGLLSRGFGEQLGSRAAIPGRFGEVELSRRDRPVAEEARRLNVDVSWVLALFVGFACLFAGHAVVNGEKEKGTLKQQLAHGLPRSSLVVGEFVGGILTVALACGLLFLGFSTWALGAGLDLDGGDWSRIGLFFLLVVLYGAFWLAFALALSVVCRRPETSLVLGVLVWALSASLYPQLAGWAAARAAPESPAELPVASRALAEQDEASARERFLARRNQQAAEYRLYRRLAVLLPVTAFLDAGQALAGSSAADHRHFLVSVDRAEESLRAWQGEKVARYPNREYAIRLDEALDIGGLPEPVHEPLRLGASVRQAGPPLGTLAAGTVLLLVGAGARFEGLDVR